MAHTVGDVIQEARDVMRDFDLDFLPSNDPLYRVISRHERLILPHLVQQSDLWVDFPGDSIQSVSVSAWAESYALPGDFWRHRGSVLNYSDGTKAPIQVVPASWENNIPPVEPALFIRGSDFYPIDGVRDGQTTSRIFGWSGASDVDVEYITEPTSKTADADALDAPDQTTTYLAYSCVRFMATRGKVADSTVQQIQQARQEAWQRMLQDLGGDPGRVNAPVAV